MTAKPRFRAVLFDLFDTLVLFREFEDRDDYPSYLVDMHKALLGGGVGVPFERFRDTYFAVRNDIVERSQRTLEEPHFSLRVALTLQKLGFNVTQKDQIVADVIKAFSKEFKNRAYPDPEAKKVLNQLHKTYKIGLVSNFSVPECGHDLLEEYGFKRFMDAVVISGDVNRRKPSPDIFETALKRLGVEAHETVFVGDSPDHEIRGPQSVGMKAILIKRAPIPEGNTVKPDAVVQKLSELPKAIKTLEQTKT